MEFALEGDLAAARDLAEQVFADHADPARIRRIEVSGGFDTELWQALADSGLLGITFPEAVGGAGLGLLGLVALMEQQGRRVTPVPVWSVLTQAALPIAQDGNEEQKERWLPGVLDGSALITGCFELDLARNPVLNAVRAGHPTADSEAWLVSGELTGISVAAIAGAFVVPFGTPDGIRVAVVAADRSGLSVTPVASTDRAASATVVFDGVAVGEADLLGQDWAAVVDRARCHGRIALAALAVGVCQEAVAITASYTSQRLQFGRPVSTNQAVALRAADAHLDAERIRLTTYKAAWHADRGEQEEARAASLVAKWWADTGGLRAVHATQHLHGGIGADVDYPIHRYFLWGRQIAFTLGSAGAVEAQLGDLLDNVTPIGAPS